MSQVRVRFAPSPTGPLHIGGVRTALFNYLFAKKHNGTFILRIEDTDQNRFVPGAEDYISEALEWCGLTPDESVAKGGEYGPYKQSERKELYQKHVQTLIENGKAYYAFDTAEDLDEKRKSAESKGEKFLYNHLNRHELHNSIALGEEKTQQLLDADSPYVVRFKTPEDETIQMNDLIRGDITIDSNTVDDKILYKSDGMPTYHLANIVDDHLMKISHVIRGEEWLPSMALHVLLYRAFGWDAPQFAHLPLILKPEGQGKLSKRDGDKHGFPVFPLEWKTEDSTASGYRESGYFPDAFINMLAFLGWNPGTEQEIFSLEELTQTFSLQKVSKSGARFNPEKAVWFNQQYLQQKTAEEVYPTYQKILAQKEISSEKTFDLQVIDLIKERANFVAEILDQGIYFYEAPTAYDAKALKKAAKPDTQDLLQDFSSTLNSINDWNSDKIHDAIQSFVKEKEIGFGKIMMPLRTSLVGGLHGADVSKIMELIGKEETLSRIQKFVSFIQE